MTPCSLEIKSGACADGDSLTFGELFYLPKPVVDISFNREVEPVVVPQTAESREKIETDVVQPGHGSGVMMGDFAVLELMTSVPNSGTELQFSPLSAFFLFAENDDRRGCLGRNVKTRVGKVWRIVGGTADDGVMMVLVSPVERSNCSLPQLRQTQEMIDHAPPRDVSSATLITKLT